jgi:hypothetical protein
MFAVRTRSVDHAPQIAFLAASLRTSTTMSRTPCVIVPPTLPITFLNRREATCVFGPSFVNSVKSLRNCMSSVSLRPIQRVFLQHLRIISRNAIQGQCDPVIVADQAARAPPR